MLPNGTISNVYSKKLNIRIPNNSKYVFNELTPPPANTRGAVAGAQGTPDYYKQIKRGV